MAALNTKSIIDDLKLAKSFDEAQLALNKVKFLSREERLTFCEQLRGAFNAQADGVEGEFRIVYVEPLNDVVNAKKPEFRILGGPQ